MECKTIGDVVRVSLKTSSLRRNVLRTLRTNYSVNIPSCNGEMKLLKDLNFSKLWMWITIFRIVNVQFYGA